MKENTAEVEIVFMNSTPYTWHYKEGSLHLSNVKLLNEQYLNKNKKIALATGLALKLLPEATQWQGSLTYMIEDGEVNHAVDILFSCNEKGETTLEYIPNFKNHFTGDVASNENKFSLGAVYRSARGNHKNIESYFFMTGPGEDFNKLKLHQGYFDQEKNTFITPAQGPFKLEASINKSGEAEIHLTKELKEKFAGQPLELLARYYDSLDTAPSDNWTNLHPAPVKHWLNDDIPNALILMARNVDSEWWKNDTITFPSYCTAMFAELKFRFGGDSNTAIAFRIYNFAP